MHSDPTCNGSYPHRHSPTSDHRAAPMQPSRTDRATHSKEQDSTATSAMKLYR